MFQLYHATILFHRVLTELIYSKSAKISWYKISNKVSLSWPRPWTNYKKKWTRIKTETYKSVFNMVGFSVSDRHKWYNVYHQVTMYHNGKLSRVKGWWTVIVNMCLLDHYIMMNRKVFYEMSFCCWKEVAGMANSF